MSLQSRLVSQFHHPSGVLGRLAGIVMASRESNLARNRWTVELLELSPADRVLELGPGPGVTLELLLDRVPGGSVVGLDHSATMLAQCERRNRAAIRQGRLVLIEGSFTDLPELPGPFDRIIAVNSLQFDGLNQKTLAGLRDCLRPGGKLAITFQPRGSNPTQEKAFAFAQQVSDLLSGVGFAETRTELLPLTPVCAACVLGVR